ncbi:MAG: sugar ABC transporter substrate-binding protein [Stagnimonas sp.]|nr:sugar ABC transporter substrate-binding protein [Stagnimonas sp.]
MLACWKYALPLGAALLLTLTACNRSGGSAATGATAEGERVVKLQVFGDTAELKSYRELIAAYEAGHPGDRVELLPVGKQADHMTKLSTAFAAGNPPDLFILNFRRFGQFAAKDALAPLGPQMSASGQFKAEDFYEPALEAFRFRDTLMCLPQNVSSLVVYYNRALFKQFEVPEPKDDWTYFGDFLSAAKLLTRDLDGDKRNDIYGVGIDPTLIRLAPFIWGMGGSLVNDLYAPSLVTLDRGPALLGLNAVKMLMTRYRVTPKLAEYQAENNDSRFARGALGMLLQSRRYTATLRELEGQGKGLDWDVAPLPKLQKEVGVLHADAYCMARDARQPEAAQRFVSYALSEAGESILARSGRTVPSRKSVATSPAFLDPQQKPARAQVFLDAIPKLKRTPNIAVWHEVESKADVLLEEWFYEPPLPGESDLDGADTLIVTRQLRDAVQPLLVEDLAREQAAKAAPAAGAR